MGVAVMKTTITAAALAVTERKDHIMDHIHIFLQDDLVAWRESGLLSDAFVDSKELKDRVKTNVQSIVSRIDSLSYPIVSDKLDKPELEAVTTLISAATDVDKLCLMQPSWQPWL